MDTGAGSPGSVAVVSHFEEERGTYAQRTSDLLTMRRFRTTSDIAARSLQSYCLRILPCLKSVLLINFALLFVPTQPMFIDFENCLSLDVQNSKPPNQQLQFQPLFVWAAFDAHSSSHNLNITVYGNVAGQATAGKYPPQDSSQWENDNQTFGKIVDTSDETNVASTLKARFNVLDYTPYVEKGTRFCNTTVQGHCPLAPVFHPENA